MGGSRGWDRGSGRSPRQSQVAIGFLRNTDSTPLEAVGPLGQITIKHAWKDIASFSINNSNFQIFSKIYFLHFNSFENIIENGTFAQMFHFS